LWVRLLQVPYHALFPSILIFCAIGVFTLNNNSFEILVMSVFGVIGYLLRKLECESAPLLLGMVLGPMIEQYLGRSLLLAHGNPLVFITQPISAVLLGVGVVILVLAALPTLSRKREQVLKDN
jgi:putative tricarboxylic transport membrane protein